MSERPQLLFVYNADSGMFNTLADTAHKIVSPDSYSCALCMVTYGWFSERAPWRAFLDQLDADCEFLHRDQFQTRFPDDETPLPAVFRIKAEQPTLCVDAETLTNLDLNGLMEQIRHSCANPD